MSRVKEMLGLEEVGGARTVALGRCLVAEALGTFFISYFGCMSCVNLSPASAPSDLILISLTFGFVVMVAVQALGHVSGAHLNPAVTLGFLAVGRISVLKGVLYIAAQCIGAIAGSGILKALTPEEYAGTLGLTAVNGSLTPQQGFGVEFFLGFLLVTVVFGVVDSNKPNAAIPAPLAIGLAVAVGHLASIEYTGSSMNPARTLGSAIIANSWEHHWVYWFGPGLGGVAAAVVYTLVFAAPTPGEYSPVNATNNDVALKRVDGGKEEVGQA